MTILYRAVNNLGNSLDGFKTRQETEMFISEYANPKRTWCVESYKADLIDEENN